MNRRLTIHVTIGLMLICFYVVSYAALLQHSSNANQKRTSGYGIWSLPPVALLAIAGEFKGLMADYLTMEAGAQLGTHVIRTPEGEFQVIKKEYDWSGIHRLLVASQTLDPSFAQTFIVAQGWLPWEPAEMVVEAQEILKVADRNRPWDWEPARAMGFNTYYFLQQLGEAGELLLQAAKKSNAPSFLSILGARLAQKGGETESAIMIMKSMLADKNPEEPGFTDMTDRLHALEGVLAIEKAVISYEKSNGRKPSSLIELTASGILLSLPPNPYGLDYCLDEEGGIYFDNPNCRASGH